MTFFLPAFAFLGFATGPADSGAAVTPRPIDFSREVRPILANYCFPCHGPDVKARKAKLRFDVSDAAVAELPSGNRAIVPGKPEESEALARLKLDAVDGVMPPPKLGKKPTSREVEILRQWIEQGARYATHWAYVPPVRQPAPMVSDPSWPSGAIDRFILARLDREGLRPSPPTDRHALLRRVSLDLTGLPPSPEEVARFVNDPSPDAYERAVDALLASPSYGERWAAVWLDLGRYGGFFRLHPRPASDHLAMARLAHPRPQQRHALRPLHHRDARRRPHARCDSRANHRDRLPSQHDHQHRRRRQRRRIPVRVRRRSGQHHDAGLDGHDFRLRPMSQS